MNPVELADYYVKNRQEFYGEFGHDFLLNKLKRVISPIIDPNIKIIGIDVGCCVGNYLQHIYDLCPEQNKQILCFEPNPSNNYKLEQIVNQNYHLKLFKTCVSNEPSISAFYNWKDSTINDIGNGLACLRGGGDKICDVDVVKLDDILDNEYKNENIIIKFMKIDTEGNDGNVIKGLVKYLPKTKYIIFECSDCLDDIRGPGIENPMKDIVDFLSKNGFDTYRIGTRKLFKVNDEYWNQTYEDLKFWSNCFALKKEDIIINQLINKQFDYVF
jgi:FkbM family methyltransferase